MRAVSCSARGARALPRASRRASRRRRWRDAPSPRAANRGSRRPGAELEMLIEIVNSLRIEDATETTRIIDGITAVYSTLNQVRAALRNRLPTSPPARARRSSRADETVRPVRLQLPRPLRHARQVRGIPEPPLGADRGTGRPLRRISRNSPSSSPNAAPNSTRPSSNARSPSSSSATAAPTRLPPPPSASSR
jgi:hypothetical protein